MITLLVQCLRSGFNSYSGELHNSLYIIGFCSSFQEERSLLPDGVMVTSLVFTVELGVQFPVREVMFEGRLSLLNLRHLFLVLFVAVLIDSEVVCAP